MKTNRNLAIIILIIIVFSPVIAGGYQYVGDFVEKSIYSLMLLTSYLILIALFSIYKNKMLFSSKQLSFLAYFSFFLFLASYIYPYFKYSEQDFSSVIPSLLGDLIINLFVFFILLNSREIDNVKD